MKIIEKVNSLFIKNVSAVEYSNVATADVGFKIPSLAQIIGYAIRAFFIIAGLAALIYLILGAFTWITSGGDKENVQKAQQKIQAAIIGLIVLVAVLSVIILIENVIFAGKVCLGLTCDLNFGKLLQ